MLSRVLWPAAILAASLFAVACSDGSTSGAGSPAGSPAPTAQSTATPAPATVAQLMQVGEQIFPQGPAGVYGVCGASGDLTACPYTERLKARLTQARATLCRCQNGSMTRVMSAEVADFGGVLYVALFNGSQSFSIPILNQNGRLLADDQTCMGRGPETSIYQSIGPCP